MREGSQTRCEGQAGLGVFSLTAAEEGSASVMVTSLGALLRVVVLVSVAVVGFSIVAAAAAAAAAAGGTGGAASGVCVGWAMACWA